MKGNEKKILCLFLSAMLGALFFASCSREKGGPNSPPAEESAFSNGSTVESEAADPDLANSDAPDPNTTYKISWTGYQTSPLNDDPFVLKYLEEKLNVEFDVWNIDFQQYEELLNVRLASGEIPDMFMVQPSSSLQKYVAQDLLAPLPMDNIETYMPNTLKHSYTDVNPDALDLGKVNGEIYGLPAMNMGNIYRLPIVYNQNWLDTLGKKVPTTIDEFEDVIYAFAHDDPDGNGVKDTYGLSKEGLNLLWGMYGMVPEQDYFTEKDGKLVYMPIEQEMKEALSYANKWYKDGVLDPEFITGENTGGYWAVSHSYINHRIGMTVIGNYYHWNYKGDYNEYIDGQEVPCEEGAVTKELLALHPDDKIAFGDPLVNTDGKQGGIKAYNILMRFYGIGANALETPGKLNKILEIYEMGSDAQPDDTLKMTIRYGFEDENWVWSERDREMARPIDDFLDDDSLRYANGAILWWSSGSLNRDRRSEWAAEHGFDRGGIYSAIPIATESMSKYDAQLQTLREQAYIQIITGEKPIDYFDTFVDEYLAQGGAEVLEQVNEWYTSLK